MFKLYEYIKMKLYYLRVFEHPLVAQLFYIIDADIERLRDLQAEIKRLRARNKQLRAEYVQLINERLSGIDEDARIAFEIHSKEVPTVPKRLLKSAYTARTIRQKAPLLWE